MLIKAGRFGKYLACSGYPACKNIQPLVKPKSLGITCPQCKEGELQEKKSRYGKIFYSCNRYPQCKYALWDKPLTEPCPKCQFPLTVEKTTIREGTVRRCPQEACDFKDVLVAPEKKAAPGQTGGQARRQESARGGEKAGRKKDQQKHQINNTKNSRTAKAQRTRRRLSACVLCAFAAETLTTLAIPESILFVQLFSSDCHRCRAGRLRNGLAGRPGRLAGHPL